MSSANTGELSFSLRISTTILYTLYNNSGGKKDSYKFESGMAGWRVMGKMMAQGVPEACPPHDTTTQPLGQDPEPEWQENRDNMIK